MKMLFLCLILVSASVSQNLAVTWHEESNLYWAEHCDWNNNELSSANGPGEQCGGKCASTQGCTHFTWTSYNGGSCWMKQNQVSRDNAFDKTDEYSFCGVMKSSPAGGTQPGNQANKNVHGTMWADATDSGGCQMPSGTYNINDALALGQETALGNLAWRNGLCGQVLKVNCGGKAVEAVVASTCNLGSTSCGVDLIKKTWNAATGNKPPGIETCTVELTQTNPLPGAGPQCFYRPDSGGPQQYYTSVGFFNTGGKIVKSAVLAGVNGKFQSGSSYMDFDAQGSPKFNNAATGKITFEDGSSADFILSDCKNPAKVQIFS